ncbi:hypothetical protein NXS19_004083 [Fusarium pseudograminearum]|nr:hypothetical protein NXS19_004083 [Fusarium pseudograminearum]
MKSTILLTLIALPFALAGPNNKARASSPDIQRFHRKLPLCLGSQVFGDLTKRYPTAKQTCGTKVQRSQGLEMVPAVRRIAWTDVLRRSSFEVAMGEMGIEPSIR